MSHLSVTATGIVVNQAGEFLIMQRDDTRTWAPPGGAALADETPAETAAREVEEETGLKVLPVRLVDLTFAPLADSGGLVFTFRCLVRGGALRPSAEALQVGYHKPRPLPRAMLPDHRLRVQRALAHQGGPPGLHIQPPSRVNWLLRRALRRLYDPLGRRRAPDPTPPLTWTAGAFVALRDAHGRLLWVRRRDTGRWNLPGGGSRPGEPPWQTAVREALEETGLDVRPTALVGVYTKTHTQHLAFVWAAEMAGGVLTPGPESAEFAWFAPGEEPEAAPLHHRERAVDAATTERAAVLFRKQ